MCALPIDASGEKVRWAFDILSTQPKAFNYVEDVHPPALQSLYTTKLDPGCSAVPIVQLIDITSAASVVVKDSTAIMKRTCPFLYPPELVDEIDEWEAVRRTLSRPST